MPFVCMQAANSILSQCNFYFCCENVALFLLDRVWYIDVAYCYRLELHGLSVGLSVVTVVSPAKTAELIVMPFVLRTWVGSRNLVLDRHQVPP